MKPASHADLEVASEALAIGDVTTATAPYPEAILCQDQSLPTERRQPDTHRYPQMLLGFHELGCQGSL